jgi:hypothetical protein
MCFAPETDQSCGLESEKTLDFGREVVTRLPLAEAVMWVWRWLADEPFLQELFTRHRGRGYEQVSRFPVLVQLIAAALLEHRGSGRKSVQRGQEQGQLETSLQSAYEKLGRVPLGLSEAWVAEGTERLRRLYPVGVQLSVPPSVQALAVVVVDGKAIKRVAKRLKPVRGRKGGVLGGKALVALELRSGVAVALATAADGETNEAKLVPALVPQVRTRIAGPRLWVGDRQLCDLTQPAVFAVDGDHFVVRYHPKTLFEPDAEQPLRQGMDPQGREWQEEWGWLGSPRNPKRRYVRRITLVRPDAEAVCLVTDLLEAEPYPATELLAVYRLRWGIEEVFQQVTEVFHLQALIGTTPHGTVFQLAFCLLLYNLLQVVRAYIATAQARPVPTISLELLFEDVHRQLIALSELVAPPVVAAVFEPRPNGATLRRRLAQLLAPVWTPRWLKAPPQKRKRPTHSTTSAGNHTSVYRLLEAYRRGLDLALLPPSGC